MLQELKQVMKDRRFPGAVLLMIMSLSGFAACDWVLMYNWEVEYRASSLQQTIGGIFFGGVIFMIPLCAALPVGIAQVDELQTGYIDYKMVRSSIKKYTARKFLSAFLGAGAAVGVAFIIHAVLWNIIATPCDPDVNEYLAIPFAEDCIYYHWQSVHYSLPIYLWMTGAIFFCGGMWGIVSITAALFTRDKILALAVPFCIYFLWHYGLPGSLLGIREFPHPADLYNDALTLPMIWKSLASYALVLVISATLYVGKLKRRYQNEK